MIKQRLTPIKRFLQTGLIIGCYEIREMLGPIFLGWRTGVFWLGFLGFIFAVPFVLIILSRLWVLEIPFIGWVFWFIGAAVFAVAIKIQEGAGFKEMLAEMEFIHPGLVKIKLPSEDKKQHWPRNLFLSVRQAGWEFGYDFAVYGIDEQELAPLEWQDKKVSDIKGILEATLNQSLNEENREDFIAGALVGFKNYREDGASAKGYFGLEAVGLVVQQYKDSRVEQDRPTTL